MAFRRWNLRRFEDGKVALWIGSLGGFGGLQKSAVMPFQAIYMPDCGSVDGAGTQDFLVARRLSRWPERMMKPDWFLARGVTLGPVEIRAALGPDGTPLSDHEAIIAQVLALKPE